MSAEPTRVLRAFEEQICKGNLMRAEGSQTVRRILCVFPRYTSSFGTFEYSYPLTDGVQAFMPPQGLLLIAAYIPKNWQVRFIDENIRDATTEDFEWAEAVFVSGMHIQRQQMNDICRRAHGFDLAVAIGGPSVSACPDYYPSFDYLHVGELGDATDELIARLAIDPSRPEQQVVLKTAERLDMAQFPIPAYELAEIPRYFLGSIQYSSGCPYQCEFCDIPGLYGRNPRLKTPQQITAELDKLVECGIMGSVYFVDDNFIGNRKAALDLLPHLVEWQKKTGYSIRFSCEATLNIAKRPEILEKMREAFFATVFCGIETPDPVALKAMRKDHNMMVPIMEAIKTMNSYGMEVVSGIILGLDTDKPETGQHLLQFIDESQIPLLTINLLQALPKTPLWDRLARENRLIEDEGRESNVDFYLPYDDVVATWRQCMGSAYEPEKLIERYEYQIRETYPNRIQPPATPQRTAWKNIRLGLIMLRNILWHVGVLGDYKRVFWKFAFRRLVRGEIEHFISSILVAHHLINFARQASTGRTNASYYSLRLREASVPAE
jgi:hopanoid C-2 methylase